MIIRLALEQKIGSRYFLPPLNGVPEQISWFKWLKRVKTLWLVWLVETSSFQGKVNRDDLLKKLSLWGLICWDRCFLAAKKELRQNEFWGKLSEPNKFQHSCFQLFEIDMSNFSLVFLGMFWHTPQLIYNGNSLPLLEKSVSDMYDFWSGLKIKLCLIIWNNLSWLGDPGPSALSHLVQAGPA